MFESNILDVAIGITLFFLFVSLMVSAAREAIAQLWKARASDLERGLRNLFADKHGTGITKDFFEHPRISALFLGNYDPAQLNGPGMEAELPRDQRDRLPSYIPAEQFSTAVVDIVASAGNVARNAALTAEQLRAAAQTFPNKAVGTAILTALDTAQDDIAATRKNLEKWFDDAMDRVGGWYKKRTQAMLFALGVVAAVTFNLDALDAVKQLQGSAALRDAAVAHAEQIKTMPEAASLDDAIEQFGGLGFSVGWGACLPVPPPAAHSDETTAATTTGVSTSTSTATTTTTTVETPVQSTNATPSNARPPQASDKCILDNWTQKGWEIFFKILGWLVTALAVTLGAPFWFDILSKFMSVRGALKPKTAEEEAAEAVNTEAKSASATARAAPTPPSKASEDAAETSEEHEWKDGERQEGLL